MERRYDRRRRDAELVLEREAVVAENAATAETCRLVERLRFRIPAHAPDQHIRRAKRPAPPQDLAHDRARETLSPKVGVRAEGLDLDGRRPRVPPAHAVRG